MSYSNQARILFALGFHRAAMSMFRLVIETHLRELSKDIGNSPNLHHRLSVLRRRGVFSDADTVRIRKCIRLCSKAIHGGSLPSVSKRLNLFPVVAMLAQAKGGAV